VYVRLYVKDGKLSVRELVTPLEETVISSRADYAIEARARADAPCVYVGDEKICSLGLRIRKGCSFHGLALNIAMDLATILRINPCGYAGMQMTQLSHFQPGITLADVQPRLAGHFARLTHFTDTQWLEDRTLNLDRLCAFTKL